MWSQTASSRLYSREAAAGASSRQSAPPPKPISEASKRLLLDSRTTATPPHKEHTTAAQSGHGVQVHGMKGGGPGQKYQPGREREGERQYQPSARGRNISPGAEVLAERQGAARPATTDFSGGGGDRGALRVISNVRASGEVSGAPRAGEGGPGGEGGSWGGGGSGTPSWAGRHSRSVVSSG